MIMYCVFFFVYLIAKLSSSSWVAYTTLLCSCVFVVWVVFFLYSVRKKLLLKILLLSITQSMYIWMSCFVINMEIKKFENFHQLTET